MPLPTSSGVAHEPAVTMRTRSPNRRFSSSSAMNASSEQFRQWPGRAYTNTVAT